MKDNSPNSRRSFLKFGAAAVAAASVSPALRAGLAFADDAKKAAEGAAAGAGDKDDEFGGLPIGIQSYTLREMSFDNMLAAMQELKITRVELFGGHLPATQPPKEALEKMKKANVTPISYGVIGFGTDHESNRQHFEIAKTYGMKNLSCDPENDPKCWESVGKLCEEYGVTAAIHPHGPGSRWVKIDQIWEAVKDQNKMIGLCNETGWFIAAGEDPVRACEVFGERMYGMHLKDFKKKEDGGLEDVPAGQGQLDVDALVKKMMEMNLPDTFALAIEYEGGDPVANVKKSLERIKEAVKKARSA